MSEAKLKDDIMRYMLGKSHVESRDIAAHFGIDHAECVLLLRRLNEDGRLPAFHLNPDSESYVTKVKNNVEIFLADGGYEGLEKTKQRENIGKISGKVWGIIATLAALVIALRTYLFRN